MVFFLYLTWYQLYNGPVQVFGAGIWTFQKGWSPKLMDKLMNPQKTQNPEYVCWSVYVYSSQNHTLPVLTNTGNLDFTHTHFLTNKSLHAVQQPETLHFSPICVCVCVCEGGLSVSISLLKEWSEKAWVTKHAVEWSCCLPAFVSRLHKNDDSGEWCASTGPSRLEKWPQQHTGGP